MSYLDIDTDGYLRALKLLREVCAGAKNVLLFAYAGGHGIRIGLNDIFVPADLQSILHHFHEDPIDSPLIKAGSLTNLVEMFSGTDSDDVACNFSLNCFWDLCRVYGSDSIDSFTEHSDDLPYNIVYSWWDSIFNN